MAPNSSMLLSACRILSLLLLVSHSASAQQKTVHVKYGYFAEARPLHAACARGWLDLALQDVVYQVTCYPQASGNYASSRLDNGELDIAHLGSTPFAQAAARGVDLQVIYVTHYAGNSQGRL